MIISWNWLKEYVALDMPVEQVEMRLMMAGLNHEGTERVGDDLAIDLEVTSNRPDCLGHLGVAREVAVLWDQDLRIPAASVASGKTPVDKLTSVTVECPQLCRCYTARVIQGVNIGPSPDWLVDRLRTLGFAAINNIVDISNYVMMECGQPLHTFDFAKLKGRKIIVREATPGETFEAIDHKTYKLEPGMCVIADAEKPVALGGVMGGAYSEVSDATTDLLIEAADFDQLSVRTTARRLGLHSPSSYRFERDVDRENIDWASRRCCELIFEFAGGELASGVVAVGDMHERRQSVVLRLSQLKRILGIEVSADVVRRILTSLGMEEQRATDNEVEVLPPSWRRDLTREIDLVEEVARIHGYDKIPEDTRVPMSPSTRNRDDLVLDRVRHVMTAAGFDEAVTISATDVETAAVFSPWTDAEPLQCGTPILRRADRLRRSLVPSLLSARRTNETLANETIELFEIAKVYLPLTGQPITDKPDAGPLPDEQLMLALTSGRDFFAVKGVIEAIIRSLDPRLVLEAVDTRHDLLDPACCCKLQLAGQTLGFLGAVCAAGLDRFDLRGSTTIAEIRLSNLIEAAELILQNVDRSPYPAVSRDLNIVLDESIRWAEVAAVVQACGEDLLERIDYQDTYRDDARLGKGKKSLLFSILLRSRTGTLKREEADALRDTIVARLGKKLGGQLRA